MALFIDRLSFGQEQIVLRVVLAEPGSDSPPPIAQPMTCVLDTGFAGELFGWRRHLELAGLDPDDHRHPKPDRLRASLHAEKPLVLPIRKAEVWLVSNIAQNGPPPLRLELTDGMSFRDEQPPGKMNRLPRMLLGMRALWRAGLRIELDFSRGECSVWTPQ